MTTDSSQNLHEVSRQWASRPDDQRFVSLVELRESVEQRKRESWTATPHVQGFRAIVNPETEALAVNVFDPTVGQTRALQPTNYAFGQLAQYAQAPASYLRTLHPQLAAINLQWGWEHNPLREGALVLGQSNGEETLRAVTSQSYGRIWDLDVVKAVERVSEDGRWQVPAASYATTNPKRATTLYASDRDVFIFLVDPDNAIEVNGERLFRGFICWNSEVGSAVFGLRTFLYRYVCDNRIVWGAQDIRELRIRHTSGAPERFSYEGAKYLRKYADASTVEEVRVIQEAGKAEVPGWNEKDGVRDWLRTRGFTKESATGAVNMAVAEEGKARTIWDVVQGVTAYARTVPYTDDRVRLETEAGKLLNLVK